LTNRTFRSAGSFLKNTTFVSKHLSLATGER